jgi:hypothetical protein
VDGRRHLILIRRDNVEHLLMIGGPTDVVVEPSIVHAAAREPAPAQATQYPATQLEAAPAAFTPARPKRQSAIAEEPVLRHANARPPLPSALGQPRSADRLAVLATGVSDQPAQGTALRAPREHEASREPQSPGAAPPQNAPAEAVFAPAAEHNSDEMAQRLIEAVLRRQRKPSPDAERGWSGLIPPKTQSEPQPEAALSAPAHLNGSARR